ncbi:MAG: Gfo/Idh/MocA family oxidoreductase [Candidatus Binatia bacterium]|nr:Gfo/Idh/MocA family oxidoreductase [Candidatus Binatia bacterium]
MASSQRNAPLPVGLIGLGKHGVRYLDHIRRDVPALRVVAVSRRDDAMGTAQAQDLGVRFHADATDLVRDPEVRGVISVVPPTLNDDIVEACASTGRPLLIEKPFAIDAASAFRLAARVESSGIPCLVAQTLRFSPVVATVREWLADLGRISQILLTQSFEPSRLGWLDDPTRSGGGNVLHTGVHMFDLLRHLLGGEVVDASCFVDRVVTTETEDNFSATFRMQAPEGPCLGAAAGSRATTSRAGQIRIVAEAGQILADHVHGTATLFEGRGAVRTVEPAEVPTVRAVLEEFSRVATGDRPSSVTAGDGAAAVAIADACYRSAETGAQVRVPTRED